jgi:hypothetical protein
VEREKKTDLRVRSGAGSSIVVTVKVQRVAALRMTRLAERGRGENKQQQQQRQKQIPTG